MGRKSKKSKAPGWCVDKYCGQSSTKIKQKKHRFGKKPGIAPKE